MNKRTIMTKLKTVINYTNELLDINAFKDYCPNGLQVQGKTDVKKIITGVTACQALIDKAIVEQVDLLLVHHGFFWKGESETLTGIKGKRVASLMKHDLNLAGYHLPLDAHSEFGNNAQLGKQLELTNCQGFMIDACPNLFWTGEITQTQPLDVFVKQIKTKLKREPLVEKCVDKAHKIAWCTGGAQDYIFHAIEHGCDTYITGEVSERTIHIARENNINFISAGHHATERYGIQALGEHLAEKFGLEHLFIDIDNPA